MNKLNTCSLIIFSFLFLIPITYADDMVSPILEISPDSNSFLETPPSIIDENTSSILISTTTDLVGTSTDNNVEVVSTTTIDILQTDILDEEQNPEEGTLAASSTLNIETLDTEIVEPVSGNFISGTIEEDQVWTKENGPYYVDNIYIPEGVTVTIKSGTEVYVGDYIVVFGNLSVEGSESDNVSLRLNYDFSSWYMFVGDTGKVNVAFSNLFEVDGLFLNKGSLDFNNVNYIDATDGILLQNGATFFADNLKVSDFLNGTAIASLSGSIADIRNSTIESDSNDYIIAGYQNGNIHLLDTTIIPAGGVPIIMVGGNLSLDNVVMKDGSKGGMELYPFNNGTVTRVHADISNTTISGFGEQGIFAIDPNLSITQSIISDNTVGIEAYEQNNLSISVTSSVIADNTVGVIFGVTNQSGTSSFDVKNNFWGDKSGPYEERNPEGLGNSIVTYHADDNHFVDFVPWLKTHPKEKHNPVIIIPGIMASYLNHNDGKDTEVWPSVMEALLSRNDSFLDDLILSQDGKFLEESDFFSGDIIRTVNVLGRETDFFSGFISHLEDNGYVEGEDLFVFPYDWRLDIADSVEGDSNFLNQSLKEKIDDILRQTKSDKVDIVAHSMGGLLAEYYIKNYGKTKVDKFIDIATPHLGAPKALKVLVYGDDMGIKFGPLALNEDEIKKISQNFPSAYNLLPSVDYFSSALPDYKYYFYDIGDVNGDGIIGRHDFSQTTSFLENTGRNSVLLGNAAKLHSDLDDFNPGDYGVDTYNIVGCGAPTIGKIFAEGNKTPHDAHYDIAYINGDGTVPERSAEYFKTDKVFYANNVIHATMPSDPGVANLVLSILDNDTDNFNYTSNPNIAQSSVNCELPEGNYISIHSPVALHIYDTEGRHTGPNENGDIEYGVPNITYDVLEDNKFVFLPSNIKYTVKIIATGIGSADVYVKNLRHGQIIRTEYFAGVPIDNLNVKGEIISEDEDSRIVLEDGDVQRIILPSSKIEGNSLEDLIPPETKISKVSGLNILGKYKEFPTITLDASDEGSGVLKAEYSIGNEENWQKVLGGVQINQRGLSRVFYRSVDNAGNIEKSKFIDLDVEESVQILNSQNRSGGIMVPFTISTTTLFVYPENDGKVLGVSVDKVNMVKGVKAASNLNEKDLKLKDKDVLVQTSTYNAGLFKNVFDYIYKIYVSLIYKIITYFK